MKIDIHAEITKHVMKHGAAGLLDALHKAAKAKADEPNSGKVYEQMNAMHHHAVAEAIEGALAAIHEADEDSMSEFRAWAD